ncbi:hypothetical protein HG263_09075 [Pseudoalteromonas sp. JBTF-M23]|uniref:Uncharacterized protein n=1 Tax=Pseudoalteromonas caenipelagi TaxID=2726988 RepID=A0A849VBM4_9GAMM|nr:DUF6136 family protein [Pseudoalteromonas caenipelagi]NOU50686.1 hypothetical protein [Pseudoalteromonas caenipelagi]
MNYFQYRVNAYRYALKELGRQIQQFALMISTLFYIFLPGLVGALFFGLGRIVQNDSVQATNKVIWGYLLLQTLMLSVLKPIVLDLSHRRFHLSLLQNMFKQRLADITLVLWSHVLLWMSLALVISMGMEKVARAPHLIVFIATQVCFAIALLYRLQSVVYALLFALVLQTFELSITAYLISINVVLLLACIIKPVSFAYQPKQINSWGFWLLYGVNKLWSLIWRFAVSFLLIWGASVIGHERPELLHWYTPMIASIALLLWGSLCLKTSEHLKEYRLFWQSIQQYDKAVTTQHILIFCFYLLSWLISISLLNFDLYVLMALLFAPAIQWCAANKPQHLAVCWGVLVVALYLIKVLV